MENNSHTKSGSNSNISSNLQQPQSEEIEEELGSDEDDGLPPLEANTNRNRPYELHSDNNSDADSDSE